MHAIQQLQVVYQRLEDHCNILWAAMLMTTGLISKRSVSQCSWTGHWSPVCRTIKPRSPRLVSCQEPLGFILNCSIFTTFAAAPVWQGEQGVSLCSFCGQLGTKTTFSITGNSVEATLCWASYCTSCKFEGGPQCAFFLWGGGWKRKASSSIWRFQSVFCFSLYSYFPAALHSPHRYNRAPKFNCWDGNMFNNILWKRHGEKFQYRWRILVPDCALGFQCISSIKAIKNVRVSRKNLDFWHNSLFFFGSQTFSVVTENILTRINIMHLGIKMNNSPWSICWRLQAWDVKAVSGLKKDICCNRHCSFAYVTKYEGDD